MRAGWLLEATVWLFSLATVPGTCGRAPWIESYESLRWPGRAPEPDDARDCAISNGLRSVSSAGELIWGGKLAPAEAWA